MISDMCFTKDWIKSRNTTKVDRSLTFEKVLMVMYLLENISQRGYDFVFKGGTSLMLHFDRIHRFSVDLDITLTTEEFTKFEKDIHNFCGKKFLYFLPDKRKPSTIEKYHYKFYYTSVINPDETPYILLDIVVDENPYKKLILKKIKLDILDHVEPYNTVKIPSIDEMLGDKLTAFAPKTVGITYESCKFTEIIKQMYDCSILAGNFSSLDDVKTVYTEICNREIRYRNLQGINETDCLDDTLNACKVILANGNFGDPNEFACIKRGITGFENFVSDSFGFQNAIRCAIDVFSLTTLLKSGSTDEFNRISSMYTDSRIKADFLKKENVRFLMAVYPEKYSDFLCALKVEKHLRRT